MSATVAITSGHVASTEVTSFVLRFGSGGSYVLLLAGLADAADSWQLQLERLGARHQVIALDNRGVGTTRCPAGPFTVEDLARDALAVLDRLGVERTHVVGASMGGAIAQYLALAHPARVVSLALSGAWCRADALFREVVLGWRALALSGVDRALFWRTVFAWCGGPAAHESGAVATWVQELLDAPDGQSATDFVRQCDALLSFESARDVGALQMPTLVMYGENDILVGERHARELVKRLPAARSAVLPDAGHTPQAECPDAFDEALTTFWGSLPPTTRRPV